jgi:PAS domain S-box-containing protein
MRPGLRPSNFAVPLLVVLAALSLLALLGLLSDRHERELVRVRTELTCEHVALRLESYLAVGLRATELIRHEWLLGEIPTQQALQAHAKWLQDHFANLAALGWISPDGTGDWFVTPVRGRPVRQHDVARHPASIEAMDLARRSDRLVVTAPFALTDGDRAVAAYRSVSDGDQSEGFVVSIFLLDSLVQESVIPELHESFSITIRDGAHVVHERLAGGEQALAVRRGVTVGDREWTVELAPGRSVIAASYTPAEEIAIGLSAFLALGVGMLLWRSRTRELELRRGRERLTAVAEHFPGVVYSYEVSPEGQRRLLYVGPGFSELLGPINASRVEADINNLFSLVHPDDTETLARQVQHGQHQGRIVDHEVRLRTDMGTYRWVRTLSRPLSRPDGWSTWHIVLIDIEERKHAVERQKRMMNELDHRVKNNLAAVLALADQTLSTSSSLEEFRQAFHGRIYALARTHEALARRQWDGVAISEVVRLVVEPFGGSISDRILIGGDEIVLPARSASALGLVTHELATNAAKHGALSSPEGSVRIDWCRSDEDQLRFSWTEKDGPRIDMPGSAGFGMGLIRGLVEGDMSGRLEIDFKPHGLLCAITAPIDGGSTRAVIDEEAVWLAAAGAASRS